MSGGAGPERSGTSASLIVDPALPYGQLADRLRALDWEWRREAQTMPTLPGEPELVVWAHEAPPALLVYTFNPAVMLRVVALSGPGAEAHRWQLASFVPHLTAEAIAALVCAEDVEACLLGMLAARELGSSSLWPLVQARTADADELVAEVAAEVAAALPPVSEGQVGAARDALGAASADPAAALALLGGAPLRRQVLRRAAAMLAGGQAVALPFILGAAMNDADWEVRASAMILCGRLRIAAAREAVSALELPPAATVGALARERLERLRRCVLELLSGRGEPSEPAARHAWRCITEGEDGVFDGVFLLVHALTTPVELEPDEERVPPWIAVTDAGFVLARSRIPVVRVAPVPSWLGDPDDREGLANPLRRVVPRAGFFLTARPLSRAMVRWLREGGRGRVPAAEAGAAEPYAATFAEAEELVRVLGAIEGTEIQLPGADAWELAARGPDGRRYPWGNGLEPHPDRRLSPWGLAEVAGGIAEWARTDGGGVACGGPLLACSRRRAASDGERLAVRPLIR